MTRSGSVHAQATVVGGLLAASGLAWWSTVARMAGMDAAPGADLGTAGWFTVSWAVMMAAMMLPSLAPAAAASRASAGVRAAARTVRQCRRPPAEAPTGGRYAPILEGISAGLCCLGCSWALMAALFALGVMSLTWMALVAVLVAFEKLAPWPRAGIAMAATALTAIAIGVAALPQNVPGLVMPASPRSVATMSMGKGRS
jgi:predicted metal-binding membrane protein